MSPDKTEELFRRFPRLYAERHLPESKSRMCDGFVCDDGWFDILVRLSAKLEPLDSKPVAFQVKEKYGELRFYLRDEETEDPEVGNAIGEATDASIKTCEVCGRPGFLRALPPNRVWLKTACDEHGAGGTLVVWEEIGDSGPRPTRSAAPTWRILVNDERLRVLARSDAPSDRARLLLARARRGELSYERLEWAARLGHEDAGVAVGKLDLPPIVWGEWAEGYYAVRAVSETVAGVASQRVVAAFNADCAERVLSIFEERVPGEALPRQALEAVRAWVVAPSEENYEAAMSAGEIAEDAEYERRGGALDEQRSRGLRTDADSVSNTPEACAAFAVCRIAPEIRPSTEFGACAQSAAENAVWARLALEGTGGESRELSWQRLRLAEYALGSAAGGGCDGGHERLRQRANPDAPIGRARVLLDRVQRGELTHQRLAWAARLGHEDASTAVGEPALPPIDWASWRDVFFAVRAVSEAVGREGFRRVAAAFALDCVERTLPIYEARVPGVLLPRRALEAARAWTRDPSDERVEAVRSAAHIAFDTEQARLDAARRDAIAPHGNVVTAAGPDYSGAGQIRLDGDHGDPLIYTPEARVVSAILCVTGPWEPGTEGAFPQSDGRDAQTAAEYAVWARGALEGRDAEEVERKWQRLRLAEYALGDVVVEGL